MIESNSTPTCPTCGYDLNGISEPDKMVDCPECGRTVSYMRALEPPKLPRTTLVSLLLVLAVPSAWMALFWAQLNIGNSLDGALIPYFSGLLLTLYLPTISAVLLIRDWHKRNRFTPNQAQSGFLKVALVVFIFLCAAMAWNWFVLMQWVEAVANV